MSLLELPLGQEAVIDRVEVGGDEGALLQAMGLLPGQPVRVLRWGPLGGPLHVRVGEAAFALGRSLASLVRVRPGEGR
jgi:Fe2+ transport system protein FeoA